MATFLDNLISKLAESFGDRGDMDKATELLMVADALDETGYDLSRASAALRRAAKIESLTGCSSTKDGNATVVSNFTSVQVTAQNVSPNTVTLEVALMLRGEPLFEVPPFALQEGATADIPLRAELF